MRYYPRLKVFKANNVVVDLNKMHATSYGWWQMLTRAKGMNILNTYPYSWSTRQHISKTVRLLEEKDISYVTLDAPQGLQSPERALEHAISHYGEQYVKAKYRRSKSNPKTITEKALRDTFSLLKKAYGLTPSEAQKQESIIRAEKVRERRLENQKERRIQAKLKTGDISVYIG